jgi:hypothetical protein
VWARPEGDYRDPSTLANSPAELRDVTPFGGLDLGLTDDLSAFALEGAGDCGADEAQTAVGGVTAIRLRPDHRRRRDRLWARV